MAILHCTEAANLLDSPADEGCKLLSASERICANGWLARWLLVRDDICVFLSTRGGCLLLGCRRTLSTAVWLAECSRAAYYQDGVTQLLSRWWSSHYP